MKTYKDFVSNIRTKKAGLEHPVDFSPDKNEPVFGKDVSPYKVPVDVFDELDGKKGKHILKSKSGKYKMSKGDSAS